MYEEPTAPIIAFISVVRNLEQVTVWNEDSDGLLPSMFLAVSDVWLIVLMNICLPYVVHSIPAVCPSS